MYVPVDGAEKRQGNSVIASQRDEPGKSLALL